MEKEKRYNEVLRDDEVITTDNVMRRGISMALSALKTALRCSYNRRLSKLYLGLVRDLNCINDPAHIFSDGFDLAQEAACFLCNYIGKPLNEVCAESVKGKPVSIKKACFSRINNLIVRERKDSFKLENPDSPEVINLSVPFEIPPAVDESERQHDTVDMLIQRMHLTARQLQVLNLYLINTLPSEIAKALNIPYKAVWESRRAIQNRYIKYVIQGKVYYKDKTEIAVR